MFLMSAKCCQNRKSPDSVSLRNPNPAAARIAARTLARKKTRQPNVQFSLKVYESPALRKSFGAFAAAWNVACASLALISDSRFGLRQTTAAGGSQDRGSAPFSSGNSPIARHPIMVAAEDEPTSYALGAWQSNVGRNSDMARCRRSANNGHTAVPLDASRPQVGSGSDAVVSLSQIRPVGPPSASLQ
jgi:hypothetical protein